MTSTLEEHVPMRMWGPALGRGPRSSPVRIPRRWVILTWLLLLASPPLLAQGKGSVSGEVARDDGSPVPGVTIVVAELALTAVTDARGEFLFDGVRPGSYTLTFSLGDESETQDGLEVVAGADTEVRKVVDWRLSYGDSLTVYSASRRTERIVEAPAAVTTLTFAQIEREASTGQLPKLFECATGAEISQSGLYDFKFNVRGVNGTVNRRVAVLIDGRNPSIPFLGSQEWSAVSFPLDDLASAELVRGPSSALYGANAFNGILNLTTRPPRGSAGGKVRAAAGDLDTERLEFRFATPLGGDWYFKGVGGHQESGDFFRSRNETLEYSRPCTAEQPADCLSLEAVPIPLETSTLAFANARFDKDFQNRRTLTVEGGTADLEGFGLTSPAGRWQFTDIQRPWARFNFQAPQWNVLATYTGRDAVATSLAAGTGVFLDSFRAKLELQGHHGFAAGRGRLVGGASVSREEVDTEDDRGLQTLIPAPTGADILAAFAQVDYKLSARLKLVLAGRWDDHSLFDPQFSPKGALVYSASPSHTFRLGYNEAFQNPNYGELFVEAPLVPPLDLGELEDRYCTPNGVSCGFDEPVQLLANGNEDLSVETIRSLDFGYNAILGGKAFLTVDYYRTEIEDFVQLFVPQLGTSLGRANPNFGPYAPPAGLAADQADDLTAALETELGDLFPLLSNRVNGDPLLILLTIVNFGRVETQGFEVGLDYAFDSRWSLEGNYAWLDFDVREELAEAPLEPNGPEHKLNLGLTYVGERFAGSLRYRWVDSFRWSEGILVGPVFSYDVVNLIGSYRLSKAWEVGVNVSNLFDQRHYEVFSGDLMERRVLAHVAYSW